MLVNGAGGVTASKGSPAVAETEVSGNGDWVTPISEPLVYEDRAARPNHDPTRHRRGKERARPHPHRMAAEQIIEKLRKIGIHNKAQISFSYLSSSMFIRG